MTDWATDFIYTRFDMHQPLTVETVAGWLREAREGALEEAAHLFDGFGDDPFTAASIAAALRSHKDKT